MNRNSVALIVLFPIMAIAGCAFNAERVAADTQTAPEPIGVRVAAPAYALMPKSTEGVIEIEAEKLVAHYVGDGNGGIKFAYWIIDYRDRDTTCVSLYRLHVLAYTKTGEQKFCGTPTKVYTTLQIDEDDIVD